jgi:hypothetical protein
METYKNIDLSVEEIQIIEDKFISKEKIVSRFNNIEYENIIDMYLHTIPKNFEEHILLVSEELNEFYKDYYKQDTLLISIYKTKPGPGKLAYLYSPKDNDEKRLLKFNTWFYHLVLWCINNKTVVFGTEIQKQNINPPYFNYTFKQIQTGPNAGQYKGYISHMKFTQNSISLNFSESSETIDSTIFKYKDKKQKILTDFEKTESLEVTQDRYGFLYSCANRRLAVLKVLFKDTDESINIEFNNKMTKSFRERCMTSRSGHTISAISAGDNSSFEVARDCCNNISINDGSGKKDGTHKTIKRDLFPYSNG